jgi:phosphoglycerol transferase MdoB-like AlkP superfamily enzyme
MQNLRNSLLPYKVYFKTAAFGIALFTCYRIIFAFFNRDAIPAEAENKLALFAESFFIGLRFDLVVTCYILPFFLIFIFISQLLRKQFNGGYKFFRWYFIVLYSIAFLICCSDIPFFRQFGSHLNNQFTVWIESPAMVLGLIFSNIMYWGFLIVFVVFVWLIKRSVSRIIVTNNNHNYSNRASAIIVFIVLGLLTFVGMRGRTAAKSPIRIGTAFFSEYYFFNQLGLNPCFTFLKSVTEKDKEWQFLSDEVPESRLHELLPLPAKTDSTAGPVKNHNVIVVLMESMAMAKMGMYGYPKLTSSLDSIASSGVFFDHFYSSGIHTFNGVFSTATGLPAVMDIHPLNTYDQKAFRGLPYWLKQEQYSNYFFTSHDAQFDNLEGFMKFNNFDRVYSQADYPGSEVISTLGVPDHYLFSYLLDRMDEHVQQKNTPFFSYVLTSTDHTPYVLPEGIPFKPTAESKEDKATQYADWAIGKFMRDARQHKWFDNTLFVFVADHGMYLGNTYAMPLSYNHIPCVFYMPSTLEPDTISTLGGQIDIMPTVLNFMNIPYSSPSPGIDLFTQQRPYMFFSSDNKIGCIDKEFYYIKLFDENKELLYKYKDLDTHNFIEEYKSRADSMRSYAEDRIKATHHIIMNKKY